jgi:hypothetical protein
MDNPPYTLHNRDVRLTLEQIKPIPVVPPESYIPPVEAQGNNTDHTGPGTIVSGVVPRFGRRVVTGTLQEFVERFFV